MIVSLTREMNCFAANLILYWMFFLFNLSLFHLHIRLNAESPETNDQLIKEVNTGVSRQYLDFIGKLSVDDKFILVMLLQFIQLFSIE